MLFKDQYISSIESEGFDEVKFNRNGPVKNQKWKNVNEDEEWSLFERDARKLLINLGAKYINLGEFKFDLRKYNHPTTKKSQIDGIGYIEHNRRKFLLIVECKHSAVKGKNNAAVRGAFNKIVLQRDLIRRRIKTIFSDDTVEPIWVLATRGHKNISKENQANFSKSRVIHLADQELDYFEDCYNISKNSYFAFNQFLGMYRSGSKPLYPPLIVGALRTHTDEKRSKFAYTFTASAAQLMPLCMVSHRKSKETFISEEPDEDEEFFESILNDEETNDSPQSVASFSRLDNYQRVLTKRRISEVSRYLERSKTPFSNNILISYRGKPKNFKWGQKKTIGQGRTGELQIEGRPGQFHVIDGQHRLFGYSGTTDKKVLEQPIIVTAFEGLTQLAEAEIFIDVNENQKKVDVSLKMEVLFLLGEHVTGRQQVENLATSIILQLRENERSPFNKNPVAIPQPESSGILATPQLKHGLMNGNLLAKQNDFKKGQLNFNDDYKKTGEFASTLLIWFFGEIKESIKPFWKRKTKQDPNGALQTPFIVGLIYLFERIIDHATNGKDVSHTELKDLINPYLDHLCDSLKNITLEQRELLFGWTRSGIALKRGTGSYPLSRRIIISELLADKFPRLIYEFDPDFDDEGKENKRIEEELEHLYDTGSVQNLVDAYEPVFFDVFHGYLLALFGDNYWHGMIQSEFKKVHSHGELVKNQKESSVKSRAREAGLKPKEILRETKEASYGNKHIWWVDWPHIRTILEGMYQNNDSLITAQIINPAATLDIKEEINKTFFIQMPGKTNAPQSIKEGLKWVSFIEMLGNPAAHKREEKIITKQEEKEFNEIKEKIIKGVITNMKTSIEELELLALDYDSIDVNDSEA